MAIPSEHQNSFASVRQLVESMKVLGYPGALSFESFRVPNFDRVASCIRWLLKRWDPSVELDLGISAEDQRVAFLKAAGQAVFSRTRIKWNLEHLYAADNRAAEELLKLASLLHQCTVLAASSKSKCVDMDTTLFKKALDVKAARSLVLEIIKAGATLYEDLATEVQLQKARSTAISTHTDIEQIENMVREATEGLLKNIDAVELQHQNCEKDEKALSATYEKRKVELERCKKRLSVLQNVRPAYVDEYDILQKDLQRLFGVYLEKFHNLQWLESQLETYNQEEQEKLQESYALMRRLQQHLHDENLRILRGEEVGTTSIPLETTDETEGSPWKDAAPLKSFDRNSKVGQGDESSQSDQDSEANQQDISTDDDF